VFANAGLLIVSTVSALSRELARVAREGAEGRIGSKSKTTEARFLFSPRSNGKRATALPEAAFFSIFLMLRYRAESIDLSLIETIPLSRRFRERPLAEPLCVPQRSIGCHENVRSA